MNVHSETLEARSSSAGSSHRSRRWLSYAIFAVLLAIMPIAFSATPFLTVSLAVQMMLLAIAGLGLVLLMGFAGQISIGQAAFYGIGAYSSAILTTDLGVSPILALVAGAVISGLVAWIVGRYIFRVRGHYLALATLAFGLALGHLAQQLTITGGNAGIVGIPRLALGSFVLTSDWQYYYLAAVVLLVVTIMIDNLVRSHIGRGLVALGDSEPAASAIGIHIAQRKQLVFVIAAVLASIAGSLYAYWVTYVDYNTMDLLLSIQLLIVAMVGGLRSVWGAVVGAVFVIGIGQMSQELLPIMFPNAGGQFEIAAYGIGLILALMFLPTGIVGGIESLYRRLVVRKQPQDTGSQS